MCDCEREKERKKKCVVPFVCRVECEDEREREKGGERDGKSEREKV